MVEYVTEDGLFSIDIVLRPPKSRGPAAASAASSRLAAVRFAPADGGNGDGSGSGSAAEASTGKSVDDNRPGASRAVADSWQGAGGVAPQEDDSPKVRIILTRIKGVGLASHSAAPDQAQGTKFTDATVLLPRT